MPDLCLLSRAQMRRIEPVFPRSRGLPRVDDRRVVSGIVYVIRNGLRWKDAPGRLWPAQDAVQPLRPLEPAGCVRTHLRSPGGRGRRTEAANDPCNAPQGTP